MMAATKTEEWTLKDYVKEWTSFLREREPFETEARRVSSYILPGRGIFNNLSRPVKRRLTAPKVINPIAKDAMQVLTSGLQGGLTPPSRPWFKLAFDDPMLAKNSMFSGWLYEAEKRLYAAFSASNFYQSIHSLYTEYVGFGTAPLYVGEDGEPFRFELLTFGEYCIGVNAQGRIDRFYRVIFRTGQMLKDNYADKLPEDMTTQFERGEMLGVWFTCLEATTPRKTANKKFTRVLYLMGSSDSKAIQVLKGAPEEGVLLERTGFNEFPYPTARWDIIGSDVYGIGAGAEALPDVIRLQEMERSFLVAVHKAVEPPLFVPAHLKGKVKTLPGGITYSRNTMNEKVSSLYDQRFDFNGVAAVTQRVEERIRRIFFNDIFLTASRDPNASPMKAAQVNKIDQEGVLRLGPVIERAWYEFLQPLLERCFNIMMRKGKFPQLDPKMQQVLNNASFTISLVSVLAQQQKAIGVTPIQSFLQFVTAVGSVQPTALDNIDADAAVAEYADITGVPSVILRDPTAVKKIRDERQQAQAAAQQQAQAMAQQQAVDQSLGTRASAAQQLSQAGINIGDIAGNMQ